MRSKDFSPVLLIVFFAAIAAFAHKILFLALGKEHLSEAFYHPIYSTYAFFAACSAVIVSILIVVRRKSIDNVGQVFLLLTCVKMGIAYWFLYPALQQRQEIAGFEKINFFIVFALFLTLETVLTIRVLNKR